MNLRIVNSRVILLGAVVAAGLFGTAAGDDPIGDLVRLAPAQTRSLLLIPHFAAVWREAGNAPGAGGRVAPKGATDLMEASRALRARFGLTGEDLASLDPEYAIHADVAGPDHAPRYALICLFQNAETARAALKVAETKLRRGAGAQTAGSGLAIATDAALADAIVARAAAAAEEKHEAPPGLARLAARLHESAPTPPDLFWYVRPGASQEEARDGDDASRRQAFEERHGLNDIQAVAATLCTATEEPFLLKSYVFAPPPRHGSLQLLQLTPSADWPTPPWAITSAHEILLLHGDVSKALNHLGPLFDDLFADGMQGTFDDILADINDPEYGLNVDLRTALFAKLGPMVFITRRIGSADKRGDAYTYVFQTNAAPQVAKTIDKLFKDDPEAKRQKVEGSAYPLWLIPGGEKSHDAGFVVIDGYVVYTQSPDLLRRALAESKGDEPQELNVLPAIAARVPSLEDRRPCLVWAWGNRAKAAGDKAEAARELNRRVVSAFLTCPASWSEPGGTADAGLQGLLGSWLPLREECNRCFGFVEPDGWSFLAY